ncbi:HTH-type transcriptional regulator BenM [Falsiruegeria litorea R37]|uniref:HTH-type transcriptional regulator BenM n=1 Tax=Falsiruegeria litorea R37 TaxID=1200284 RepID=A0A1Y5T6E2_9RHOB|nr:LysR family transcriptional regulator [Falsiruegeria litorea]SLN56963.1 HTH-type transcriptional regulator BenM [Falsiruegeria litorea R37]
MNLNNKALHLFVGIIEEGSLARASQRMNLSAPAASRLIQILELEAGATLFYREHKQLIPTSEAELFYPEAVRILSAIDNIPEFFNRLSSEHTVPLRILCHPRAVNGLVLPAMTLASKRDPGLRMQLEIHPRRNLGRTIELGLFDVGISTLPLPVKEMRPTLLAKTQLHVLLPKNHAMADKTNIETNELIGEDYIAMDKHTVIRRIVDRTLAAQNLNLPVKHEVSAGAAAYRLVREGGGFTFADPLAVEPELLPSVALIPWHPISNVEYGYFETQSSRKHAAHATFVDCLNEICSQRLSGFA